MPKRHLVRRSFEYRHILKRGKKINFPSIYVYALVKENGPTRLGLVVSRKVGGAFLRNRYKRIIREYFRLHYRDFPAHVDIVVGVKPSVAHAGINSFRLQLQNIPGELQLL